MPERVLVVDLHNFGLYPTLAVGYIASALRGEGIGVEVVSPLAHGITGIERERPATALNRVGASWRQATALSPHAPVRSAREWARKRSERRFVRRAQRISETIERRLDEGGIDLVLVTTYLMYAPVCERIGRACEARGLPLIVGGPYFVLRETVGHWLDMPGVRAVVGGEAEPFLAELVRAAASGERLDGFAGVSERGRVAPPAPPLRDLDAAPFPDFTDFPWHRYPRRIVPVISGRGCGWGSCTFCSDITSGSGRTFRSRSPARVLDELEHQARTHDCEQFVFTDLKLNSDPAMWRALIDRMPGRLPAARWVAAVHIGGEREEGLSAEELGAARAAGCVRLTTGLESGSQRMLDLMYKGTDLARTSRFLHDAHDAGISVRTTMIIGYPGEETKDLLQTASFLERHAGQIERVTLNRLQVVPGTRLAAEVRRRPDAYPAVADLTVNGRSATMRHYNAAARSAGYRRAVQRVVAAAHRINRMPLDDSARAFEGVM